MYKDYRRDSRQAFLNERKAVNLAGLNVAISIITIIIMIDMIGFILWSVSGQQPADGFYIGAITKGIISLIR